LFNPTLSLSSIAVGYESIAAAGYLIVAGLIIKDLVQKDDKKLLLYIAISSAIFGFMSFIQPRLIVSGILINLLWILILSRINLPASIARCRLATVSSVS
jgi:hypothetical protein